MSFKEGIAYNKIEKITVIYINIKKKVKLHNVEKEIKNILKQDSILYLSIPNIKTEHNTIYPGLLYPVNNFEYFLKQMAFEIVDHKIHDKCFYQEVYVLKNKDWSHGSMLWHKNEDKFRNIPPHISINL